jgi:hypothetical protein
MSAVPGGSRHTRDVWPPARCPSRPEALACGQAKTSEARPDLSTAPVNSPLVGCLAV